MEFKELVFEKIGAYLDENIEKIIEANVQSAIQTIIKNSFSAYGAGAKALEKKIEESIGASLEEVTFDEYQNRIVQVITHTYGEILQENAVSRFEERIRAVMQPIEKKDWLLSEIIDLFGEYKFPSYKDYFHPTVIVENSNTGYRYLYLSEVSGRTTYECEYVLSLDKTGKVWNFKAPHARPDGSLPILGQVDQLFFGLYAFGCTITLDSYKSEFYKHED